MNTEEETCDHEWETQTVDNGDGIWSETYNYDECIKCGKTKEYEPEYFDGDY